MANINGKSLVNAGIESRGLGFGLTICAVLSKGVGRK